MDHVEKRIRAALEAEGFGVLTEIDVQATIKKKLNLDRPPMRILGACNPGFAHEILNREPDASVFLPCNVVVYEHNGETIISAMNPVTALTVMHNPDLESLAVEIERRITRALDAAVDEQA